MKKNAIPSAQVWSAEMKYVLYLFGGIERGSLYSKQYSSTAAQPTHRPRSLAAIVFFCPFISAGTNSSREKKITAALDFEKLSILFSI